MRVFLGPARASSLREDGKELTALLGATKFALKHQDGDYSTLSFAGDWGYVQKWRQQTPDSAFGLLIMFEGMTVYAEQVERCLASSDYNCDFVFDRIVPAPFLPTNLL